jgi:hypothetical protein
MNASTVLMQMSFINIFSSVLSSIALVLRRIRLCRGSSACSATDTAELKKRYWWDSVKLKGLPVRSLKAGQRPLQRDIA